MAGQAASRTASGAAGMGLRLRGHLARGLAQAGFVAAGAVGLPAGAAAQERASVLLSFGPDLGCGGRRAWREGVLTGEYRSANPALWGLRPAPIPSPLRGRARCCWAPGCTASWGLSS